MKILFGAFAVLAALAASEASAQPINLTGDYHCIAACRGPGPAFITQNGWSLNVLNEVGEPSRGWIDRPGHIWLEDWHQGAIYSPDGFTIQFDSGTIWQRGPVPPPPPLHRRG